VPRSRSWHPIRVASATSPVNMTSNNSGNKPVARNLLPSRVTLVSCGWPERESNPRHADDQFFKRDYTRLSGCCRCGTYTTVCYPQ
jgi:hypothetical protein